MIGSTNVAAKTCDPVTGAVFETERYQADNLFNYKICVNIDGWRRAVSHGGYTFECEKCADFNFTRARVFIELERSESDRFDWLSRKIVARQNAEGSYRFFQILIEKNELVHTEHQQVHLNGKPVGEWEIYKIVPGKGLKTQFSDIEQSELYLASLKVVQGHILLGVDFVFDGPGEKVPAILKRFVGQISVKMMVEAEKVQHQYPEDKELRRLMVGQK